MHSILSSRTSRPVISLLALGSLLLLSGCDLNFWKMTGHQTTMVTAGPVAKSQLDLFYVTCWVTLVIFILVGSVLAYATFKFKARSDADEHAEPPPQSHGNPLVEMSLIAASVLSLVIIAIPTLKGIWYTHDVPEAQAANAYNINATGYQWWFKFEYPAEKLDNGMLLSTGNELVIPAGRPVRIQIRTTDVIHSFWVPKLAGKVDMIPNRGNFLWLQADEGGYFWGQCAEYCGDSHAVMRFRVIALAPMEFAAWVANQKGPARGVVAATGATAGARPQLANFKKNEYGFTAKWAEDATVSPLQNWQDQQKAPASEDTVLIAEGKNLFWNKSCIGCHTVRGMTGRMAATGDAAIPAMGVAGPDLTHVGARTSIAAGLLENTPAQLARWIAHPDQVKPGNKMYVTGYQGMGIKISDPEAVAIAAFLSSLK
jgi:cytochrome c oxidase subunit 2